MKSPRVQGSHVFCGTTASDAPNAIQRAANRALDGVVAFNKKVFEMVGSPVMCPIDVPRHYEDTGCRVGPSGAPSCPATPPPPFGGFSNAAFSKIAQRALWASKGRSGSGCCLLADKRVLCSTTSDNPSKFLTWKNELEDKVGAFNSNLNDMVGGVFDRANNFIRDKLQDLVGRPDDRQNVLAQYVEARSNMTASPRPQPRTLVGKLWLWATLRHARNAKRLDETALAFKFGPTDPGWVTAFNEYLTGVAKLLPMWSSRSHIAMRSDFVYKMENKIRIGVIGDWGTGNQQSVELATQMVQQLNPAKFIHLGDIYYACTNDEMRNYFTSPLVKAFKKTTARELQGIVYNLPGNHDYYGGAKPFFDTLDVIGSHQGSYFVLENENYAIIGIDTALNDSDPAETAKGVKCTTLPADHLAWTKAQIDRAKAAKRGVIMMSHHMLFSSHAGSTCGSEKDGTLSFTNDGLYNQFGADYINKIDMWIWGHEHAYTRYAPYKGLRFGYLLGNGGVPTYVENKPYSIKVVRGQVPPRSLSPIPGTFTLEKGITDTLTDFKLYNSGLFDMQFDGPSLVLTYYELVKQQGGVWNLVQGQQQRFSSATGVIVEQQ